MLLSLYYFYLFTVYRNDARIVNHASKWSSVDCFFSKTNIVWHQYGYCDTMLGRILNPSYFHGILFRRENDTSFD